MTRSFSRKEQKSRICKANRKYKLGHMKYILESTFNKLVENKTLTEEQKDIQVKNMMRVMMKTKVKNPAKIHQLKLEKLISELETEDKRMEYIQSLKNYRIGLLDKKKLTKEEGKYLNLNLDF
jgi:hypothetical protein